LRFPLSVLRSLGTEQQHLGGILHIGLSGDDPELTLEDVEEMLDLETLPSLQAALKKATAGLIDLSVILPAMFPVNDKGDGAERPTVEVSAPAEEEEATQSQ
jgi:hypothetical protein